MPINGFLYPGASGPVSPYEVANSVRLDGSSAYMTRTMGTPTNTDKYTFSFWVKRSKLGSQQSIFRSTDDGTNDSHVTFQSDDTLRFEEYGGLSSIGKLQTTQKFRDVSAWYHIVLVYDSGNSTAGNRMRMYVNGTEVTAFGTDTNPSQNADSFFNKSGESLHFGRTSYSGGGNYFGGYLAEVVMCDGQALDPTSFGEFDSDSPNIWKPIDVSGLTFGNNGFYLDFEDSGDLGDDESGNGNDFTETNLAATDQSTDTCTNNFATLNSLVKAPSSITFSEGNLKAVHPGSWTGVPATIGVQSGRWYWEVKATTGNSANAFTGICIEDVNFNDSTVYDETGLILYFVDGRKTVDGTDTESFFSSLATNDIVGVALDLDSGTKTVTFTKNGSASGSAVNLTSNFDNKFIFPVGIGNSSSATANWEFNFGSPHYSISSGNSDGNGYGNFEYSVPSNHYSLNSKNLAEFG